MKRKSFNSESEAIEYLKSTYPDASIIDTGVELGCIDIAIALNLVDDETETLEVVYF